MMFRAFCIAMAVLQVGVLAPQQVGGLAPTQVVRLYPEGQAAGRGIVENGVAVTQGPGSSRGRIRRSSIGSATGV